MTTLHPHTLRSTAIPVLRALPARPKFSQELRYLAEQFADRPARLSEILAATQGRGFNLLLLLIGLPFLTPIPLPGLSTPFGFVVLLIGARLALGRRPWLPEKILHRELPARFIARLLGAASRIVRWLEVLLRPRLDFLHEQWIYRRIAGTLIMLSGFATAVAAAHSAVQQLAGTDCGSAGRRRDGAGRSLFSGRLRHVQRDARLLRSAGLWRRSPPRQPAAHSIWIMKSESQTQLGAVMEAPCLVQAAATELAKHHSVEAIAIKAVEGKISVATIGRAV